MSATSTSLVKEQYIILQNGKYEEKEVIEGPSPYFNKLKSGPSYVGPKDPPKVSGILDETYKYIESTPVLGREYLAQLKDILEDDEKIRDLAIIISQRGVIFFRNQDLTINEQKILTDKLGKFAGKPETSKLHIHPITPGAGFLKADGNIDPEVYIVSSELQKKVYTNSKLYNGRAGDGYHVDIIYEPVPSDYSTLKIIETPNTGGDTLFSSASAQYDKYSTSFRSFLETLTVTFDAKGLRESADRAGIKINSSSRGAPENIGDELIAVHPLVQTDPVTGWKSIISVNFENAKINELSEEEGKLVFDYIKNLNLSSHDTQVRFKWGKNDIALWSNKAVYHSGTNDFWGTGIKRTGVRVVSIGSRPYLDPKSKTRGGN